MPKGIFKIWSISIKKASLLTPLTEQTKFLDSPLGKAFEKQKQLNIMEKKNEPF